MKNFVIFFIIALGINACKQVPKDQLNFTSGNALGTSYSIQFIANETRDYTAQFDSLFAVINTSMSTYLKTSDISKINRNEAFTMDTHFTKVFDKSKEIYQATQGVFDPTVGVMVNAWDFGPEKTIVALDSLKIDSLMRSVGFDKITREQNTITKQYPNTFLDFNAIAKGYTVDVIAEFLEQRNIANYLVEIGGELRGKGINVYKKKPWRIGIEDPNFDGTQSVNKIIALKDKAMATSGTYRKFKIDENGKRYSHIINTETGYPSKTNVLSVSVLANTCMEADAYATAFKAMGLVASKEFLRVNTDLQAYFIFEKNGKLTSIGCNDFPE